MKIGIDIDEVVVEFAVGVINYYNRTRNKRFTYAQLHSYNFWEAGLGENREDSIGLVGEFFKSEDARQMELVDGVRGGLDFIKKNHEGYFITSRPEWVRPETERFLKEKGFDFPVYFSGDFHGGGRTKVEIAMDLGLNKMVEDSWKYAQECASKGIGVYLFNRPWNQGKLEVNPKRVGSWEEIIGDLWRSDGKL